MSADGLSSYERRLLDRALALKPPALFAFDVDGTLAPIVKDPMKARVPSTVLRSVRALAKMPHCKVALITGRDAHALAKIAPIHNVYRAVEHGARVLAPGQRGRSTETSEERGRLSPFERWARNEVAPMGATVEVKRGARAIHVRKLQSTAPKKAELIMARADKHAKRLGLCSRRGRAVLEVSLVRADKYSALETIAKTGGCRALFYAGDDLTDSAALRLASARGLGIFIRSTERPRKPTGVTGSLRGPRRMAVLLEALVHRI